MKKMTEEMKMGMEWKPCPFCGGTDFILSDDEKGYYEEPVIACAYISCTNCKGEMWSYDGGDYGTGYRAIIKRLNEKWNRRVGS